MAVHLQATSMLYEIVYLTLGDLPLAAYGQLAINVFVNIMVLSTLSQMVTLEVVGGDYQSGLWMFALTMFIQYANSAYSTWILESHRIQYNASLLKHIESCLLGQLRKISDSDAKRLLEGDFHNRENDLKWSIHRLLQDGIMFAVRLVPGVYAIGWLSVHCPMYVIATATSVCVYIRLSSLATKDNDLFKQKRDRYREYSEAQLSEMIHNRGDQCHTRIVDSVYDIDVFMGTYNAGTQKYYEKLELCIGSITIIYTVVLGNILTAQFAMLYIQYVKIYSSNISGLLTLVKSFTNVKKELGSFSKLFKNARPSSASVQQCEYFNTLTIAKGSQFVREETLALRANEDITFKRGQVIYIEGASGCGKTTLFDIIAGITPHADTDFTICIDSTMADSGFEHIKSQRTYVASDIKINLSCTTIYNVITSNDEQSNPKLVESCLQLAECSSFVNNSNLHTKGRIISKGEISRLKVARYMYNIIKYNSTVVLLDEIADGVDKATTVKVADNIYSYFRKNNILCLVTTHNEHLQQMEYDVTYSIVDHIIKRRT
jgi:ABC-type lipoprotein export system ATPase subunit